MQVEFIVCQKTSCIKYDETKKKNCELVLLEKNRCIISGNIIYFKQKEKTLL